MNGSVVEGAQGLCPSGWHIPTDTEYQNMEIALGMTSANASATGWRGSPVGGNSNLEVLPIPVGLLKLVGVLVISLVGRLREVVNVLTSFTIGGRMVIFGRPLLLLIPFLGTVY